MKEATSNNVKIGDRLEQVNHPEYGVWVVDSIQTHDESKIVNLRGRRGSIVMNDFYRFVD